MFELKESYDEILKALGQLELSAKEKVGEVERELAASITNAQVHTHTYRERETTCMTVHFCTHNYNIIHVLIMLAL